MADKEIRIGASEVETRKMGVFSVVGMFYAICCAGAFGVEEMIPECGPGMTIALLIGLPIVWGLPYSYIIAEMGAARPVEGGTMIWIKEALGEYWFSICVFVEAVWTLVCNTVYIVLAVSYLGKLVELTQVEAFAIKAGLILLFFVINVIGLKEVGFVSTALSILIMIAFAAVAVVGFMNWSQNPFEPFVPADVEIFEGLGTGLAIGIWMYSGFDELSVFGGEIENSHKIIPKALLIVIPLMCLTYILPTMGGLASIGQWEDWTTEIDGVGYSEVLLDFAGPVAAGIFLIIAILGQLAIFNVCLATGSRTLLILADSNLAPKGLARLTKKKGTPYVALIIVAVITMALIPFDFGFLVVVDVFFMLLMAILTVISCAILRRGAAKNDLGHFRFPGGTPMHNVCVGLVILVCIASVLLNGTEYFLGGMIWLMIVPFLYIICKKIWGGLTVSEPEMYPVNPKTGLGFGHLKLTGYLYIGIGLFGLAGRLFLGWWESDWGPEYYLEEWESGLFSDFYLMLTVIIAVSVLSIVMGIVFLLISKKKEC